jgi:hypothetical protein
MGTFSAARQFVTYPTLAAVLIVLVPALSAAQEPVKSFDQLNTRLKVGDTVWVTDAQGREIKGKIRSLDAASLSLDGASRITFRAGDALTIATRRPDSLKNGILIGFLVGAVGLEAVNLISTSQDDCPAGCQAVIILLGGACGIGVGAAVDALIPGKKVPVYRAPGAGPAPRLSIAPVITPRTKGVAVAFSF